MATPTLEQAARLALQAFPWEVPGPEEDLVGWVSAHLWRNAWSSTEEAVLHLAASLLGIEEYPARVYGEDGEEQVNNCRVPPLSDILIAGFDDRRRSCVAGALEAAFPAPSRRPGSWAS